MQEPITVDKKSEFFITIAKKGIHSFVMLGVVMDGRPEILASIGKGNGIDKRAGGDCGQKVTYFGNLLGSHTDGFIVDESRINLQHVVPISYQAYSITYEQYLEFLTITRDLQRAQLEYYKDREDPQGEYKKLSIPEQSVLWLRRGIKCYIPQEENSDQITFEYQGVDTFDGESAYADKAIRREIIDGARDFNVSNTCRTSARSILNYTLQYSPNVPALFAIGLEYQTKLVLGKPTPNTFYILPSPPNCFQVNPTQMNVLNELYQKLENLPKNQPSSEVTRKKFNELKHIYQEIAGEPQLSLVLLLDKITTHRITHNSLFDIRRSSMVNRFIAEMFGMKTGTQQTYDRMEKAIIEEMERVKKVEARTDKGVDEPQSNVYCFC